MDKRLISWMHKVLYCQREEISKSDRKKMAFKKHGESTQLHSYSKKC